MHSCLRIAVASLALSGAISAAPSSTSVVLIFDSHAAAPVRHGIRELEKALAVRGARAIELDGNRPPSGAFVVVAGVSGAAGPASAFAHELGVVPPTGPEALLIHHGEWHGHAALLVLGSDSVGLMYALLDVADRVGWAPHPARPFTEVRDTVEHPYVAERGITIFTMQKAWFEQRLHDPDYWRAYFDQLARDRYNDFRLLFAYEMRGYLYPPYPYFFDVPGYPGVHVVGLTKDQQRRNLDDLNRLIRMAHDRGLKVMIGIWDHIYRGQSSPTPGLVWGLNDRNLLPYTKAALTQFFRRVHGVDQVQFLMHAESGLKTAEMKPFWESIFRLLRRVAPNVQYEARAKGVPDNLIEYGRRIGLHLRMNTKYWYEQVGLPFDPTHVQELNQFDRRHGYSDMLEYPHRYDVHWTLWTCGTIRILLWGDPDYVRRFVGTVQLAGTHGFDVMEPLATKMAGHPQDEPPVPLLRAPYRYYRYEFQRYWYFFQLFGRLAYNPHTPSEVWDREFIRHFGPRVGPVVEAGLNRASQILPRIVAYCLPPDKFPTTRGWPERQRWDDLPEYAASEPSDTCQFESFKQAARRIVEGGTCARITPAETARWLNQTAADVERSATEAAHLAGSHPSRELVSTLTDLHILAALARYHAARIPAGVAYAVYRRNHDLNELDAAIAAERKAVAAWRGIVAAAGNVYSFDLAMGLPDRDLSGHWRDELPKFARELAALEREREAYRAPARRFVGHYAPPKSGVLTVPLPDGRYEVTVKVRGPAGPMWIETDGIAYSDTFSVAAGAVAVRTLPSSVRAGKLHVVFGANAGGNWSATDIEVSRVDPWIAHTPTRRLLPGEAWIVRATVSAAAPIKRVSLVYGNEDVGYRRRNLRQVGPLIYQTKVPPDQLPPTFHYHLEAVDEAGRPSRWPAAGKILVRVSADRDPPQLQMRPATEAIPGRALHIVAHVTDPSGVAWVRLCYRGLTQHQDYATVDMLPTGVPGQYAGDIPGADIDPRFDLMYFVETMDRAGNGRIYPDLERQTPYIIVPVRR